jgi:amino acid permease
MINTIHLVMTIALFAAGFIMLVSGFVIILSREYQETMRVLSNQSTRLSTKVITDVAAQVALAGTAQLLDSITRLIQTAIGTGVFLCLLGAMICGVSLWLLTLAPAL